MATSKAWAASEKNMYSLLPFILVFPCLPFFVFFLKFPMHWQIWVRIRDATLLLRIYFVAHLYPGWTAWADRVAPLPGLGVYTSPCLDTAARYSGPKQQQKNAPIFFRYSNGVLFWRSGIPMDISMGLFVSNFVSPNSERAWKKKHRVFFIIEILGFPSWDFRPVAPPGVLDSNGVGVVLVALAAPGLCWYEKSRPLPSAMVEDFPFVADHTRTLHELFSVWKILATRL